MVIDIFEKILTGSVLSVATKEFGLTALGKLADRLESQTERIYSLIRQYTIHMNLELQQRSVEFGVVLTHPALKHGLFERMPIIAHNTLHSAAAPISNDETSEQLLVEQPIVSVSQETKEVDFLDGLFGNTSTTIQSQQTTVADDILGLFGINLRKNDALL